MQLDEGLKFTISEGSTHGDKLKHNRLDMTGLSKWQAKASYDRSTPVGELCEADHGMHAVCSQ